MILFRLITDKVYLKPKTKGSNNTRPHFEQRIESRIEDSVESWVQAEFDHVSQTKLLLQKVGGGGILLVSMCRLDMD
jgi:hypothetical protein